MNRQCNYPKSRANWLTAVAAALTIAGCAETSFDEPAGDTAAPTYFETSAQAVTFVPPSDDDTTGGLLGQYYDTRDFTVLAMTRVDETIDFDWGNGAPSLTMGTSTFSVRWTGTLRPPTTGNYRFRTTSDDGSRLFIDGARIVDNWGDHGSRSRNGDIDLVAGESYAIEVQYYENGGGADMRMDVSFDGGSYFLPPGSWFSYGGNGTGLHAAWWDTRADMEADSDPAAETLKTTPVFYAPGTITLPPSLGLTGDPPAGVNPDQWAVRATGYLEPPRSGEYQIAVECSGPFKLWIDTSAGSGSDPIVMDHWDAAPGTTPVTSVVLEAGRRLPLRFDYEDAPGDSTCRIGWRKPLLGTEPASSSYEYIAPSNLYPAALGTGTGLTGHYFDNRDFTNLVNTRVDRTINFDFGSGAPSFADGAPMGSDNFSIEWRGFVEPLYTERYTFHMTHDDGVRLWIDDVLVVNQWNYGSYETSGEINLVAGVQVPIRIEYFEGGSGAGVTMSWSSDSQFKQLVPQTQLFPQPPDPSGGSGLEGHYYNEQSFTDFYAMRIDPIVNFNWGSASPMPGTALGADTFSIRWYGQVRPRYTETYTFETWSDDGVALWINGEKIIDDPTYHGMAPNTGEIELLAGKRYDVRMEMFEGSGGAGARLLWSSPSQNIEVIPTGRLFPPPVLGTGAGLLGEYYGAPDHDERELRLVRVDRQINFEYTDEAPGEVLPPRNHSIRWRGQFEAVFEELYTLSVETDGGVRMRIDGVTVIDQWVPTAAVETYTAELELEPGLLYDIEIDYWQEDEGGTVQLFWESYSQLHQLVPARQMYAAEPSSSVDFGECESVIRVDNFNPEGDDLPDGLEIDGGLTLTGDAVRSPDLWVANTNDATVTRINTDDGSQLGVYPVGYHASRTAVDLNYDVWVANRAFGYRDSDGDWHSRPGTVDKIYADCECPSTTALCSECVAFRTTLPNNSMPRGLAVDADNNVWVGTYGNYGLYKLDNETGDILATYTLPVRPYGLAIDQTGRIWIASINSGIACFDTVTGTGCGEFTRSSGQADRGLNPDTCLSAYGVAVDGVGNVWFGNWSCGGLAQLDRASYDASVEANTVDEVTTYSNVRATVNIYEHTDSAYTRGVAVDGRGMVWVASSSTNRLMQFDPETSEWVGSYSAPGTPIGVGITDSGNAVAVSYSSNIARAFSPEGDLEWSRTTGNQPYSYSDMTGFQLRNFTAPQGVWNRVFDCDEVGTEGCVFDYLTWDAVVPSGAGVSVRFRVGEEGPDGEPVWDDWSPRYATTPSPLGSDGYSGRFVEIEVTLTASDRGDAPVLHAVQLWRCPQIYEPTDFDVDDRWIISQDDRNYAISWQITDDSWPETRWEFLDNDGSMRCLLNSDTSITKGQQYAGDAPFPACVETYHLSNVPVQRTVRTAYFDADQSEWKRSEESASVLYYTRVNNPTVPNGDLSVIGRTNNTVWINWCRPENNWSAGITGARVTRWTGSETTPDPGSETTLSTFPTDPTVTGRDRGYGSDTMPCGTFADTGLTEGTVYYYQLEYQNGDGLLSEPLVLPVETYGRPCCDELAEGCDGVCAMAVTGPDGCEYPSLFEDPEATCDEFDNDCDGEVDEGLTNACGFCGPAPLEYCDGIDNDCDGSTDEDPADGPTYYFDGDGDGFGGSIAEIRCSGGGGWTLTGGDCNDADPDIHPDATEVCDGIDNNCNGSVDESGEAIPFYRDADGDGYGDAGSPLVACLAPSGYVADDNDCDDTRETVHPGAAELCDGLDNNCDGTIDEGWADIEVTIVSVQTTAVVDPSRCENDYGGLACEGALAVEFSVENPSAFDVPTDVQVEFRMEDGSGPSLTAPTELTRAVAAGSSEIFTYCFGMAVDATEDLWIGIPDIEDHMPMACGEPSASEPDVNYTGGDEICDGLDNDCDGDVDDNACGVTNICVETLSGDYRCVAAMTEEGDCEGGDCIIECGIDDDCGDGAECRNGGCVDARWLSTPEEDAAAEAAAGAGPDGVGTEDSFGSQEPGEAGCSSVSRRGASSAGWAGMLFALMLVRRRRCRGACRT